MLVFTALGHWLNVPTGGAPRPVLVFAALLPWQLFSNALNASSNSLVSNSHLISKVYFPRLLVPLSAVAVSLVDFMISALFLVLLMIVYGVIPNLTILFLPLALLLTLAASLSVGLWLTALNVKYRDFRHILPFIIQLGLFISPVAFTSEVVPEKWKPLYSLNPMVGVIDTFRWALLGQGTPPLQSIAISCLIITVLLYTGIRYFRQTERRFADLI
jgi:lipopolysaccharide transport system permease protein